MKPQLKTLTWSDFDQHEPCYSPQKKYGYFEGTIINILQDKRIPNTDKIWAFTREGVMDDETLRLFAVRCARQVQHLMKDERSLNALDVAERYANGLATAEELAAARAAALAAELAAELAAARAAAWAAALAAAWAAAWAAARAAARAAAWEACEACEAWEAEQARANQVKIATELIKEFYEL